MGINGCEDEGCDFEIPLLPDMYGATALDICLSIDLESKESSGIFYRNEANQRLIKGSENVAMANIIFDKISVYSFMHSSAQVTEALIRATQISLPSIGNYMESRLQHVDDWMFSKTQNQIRSKVTKHCPGMGTYGFIKIPIWVPEDQLKQ